MVKVSSRLSYLLCEINVSISAEEVCANTWISTATCNCELRIGMHAEQLLSNHQLWLLL